jgi:RNA polymerase sigma factor (sigma-70 family)
MNGTDLLADFREKQSEGAFSELVRRYTNLVYSVAKRRLPNASLAQEITQIVFIRLAKAAPKLRSDAELAAWLHRTTVHVSIDQWRSETRRRVREEHAAAMQTDLDETLAWNEMAPVLDEALNELNDADRQAVLLRFFDHKTMRELGAIVGVSEDAAKMRVSRALDRLRSQLVGRGVTCGAMALGTMLSNRSVEAAPSSLVAALLCLSFPVPATVVTTAGAFGSLLHVSRMKLVAGLATSVLVGVVSLIVFRSQDRANRVAEVAAAQSNAVSVEQNQQTNTSVPQQTDTAAEDDEPDPLKLLQTVAQAREQIGSGSMELQLATERLQNGHIETNQIRLSALFDDKKLRMEQVGREYRYTAIGEASAAQEARMKEEGLDRAAAVREGLLQGFEAHYFTAYDGAALLTYRETDGKSAGAVIDDSNKGSSQFIFDPRCLGLSGLLSVGSTIKNCLGYAEAKAIKLVGRELVAGVPAWHVEVRSKYDAALNFWIDVAHPDRVLKHASARDVVLSKYDDASPIPTEVTTMHSDSSSRRLIRSNAQFNVPVDPASWTLAGLGMAVGTDIVDVRIHRSIGYWTGTGLSEDPPPNTGKTAEPQNPPNLVELMNRLEYDPGSNAALEAATWILLNIPDGPEVEKAAEVILRDHIQNPGLLHLCRQLERLRHRSAKKLLAAVLENNPNVELQATACFTLATLLKDEAKFGQNKKATAEADKLFERVTTEFARIGPTRTELARRAKPELYELRHVIIGKPAPVTEGEDLNRQKMNLNDYRGKVVVLMFWTASTASDAAAHRKMLEGNGEKPIALVGVNCDKDLSKAKAAAEKHDITWPSFWDKRDGPISTNWNVNSWLTVLILDPQGVIRYRGLYGREFIDIVDALLRE